MEQKKTTLHEISGDNYVNLPQLPALDANVISVNDFSDPEKGLVEYEGRVYWFQMCHDYDSYDQPYYRRFLVVKLTDEQLAEEQYWHDLFLEKIGTYDTGGLKPKQSWSEYYVPYRKRVPPDLSNNEVLGWWEQPLPA